MARTTYVSGDVLTATVVNDFLQRSTGDSLLANLDAAGYQLTELVVHSGGSLPTGAGNLHLGMLFFRTDTLKLYICTGISPETWAMVSENTPRRIVLTAAGATVDGGVPPEQVLIEGTNHDYYALKFDKATDEIAYWHFAVPTDYVAGNVTVKVIWKAVAATTGDVIWGVQTLGVTDSEAWDAALSAAQTVTETTDGAATDISVSTIAAFNPGWAAGDQVILKLYRDANAGGDTMDEDAVFLMLTIDYTGA